MNYYEGLGRPDPTSTGHSRKGKAIVRVNVLERLAIPEDVKSLKLNLDNRTAPHDVIK
jgi:hypothetical protein